MVKRQILLATATCVVVLLPMLTASAAYARSAGSEDTLFESEGMRGVQAPFLNPVEIRGVRGPGAPWILDEGEVEIERFGMGAARLRVSVDGLVLDPATVPPPVGGTNPVPNFRAIVSCLDGVDGVGNPTFTNVVTDNFPADVEGNADVDTIIALPDPCFGIVVFVTTPFSPERWFAVTGPGRGL